MEVLLVDQKLLAVGLEMLFCLQVIIHLASGQSRFTPRVSHDSFSDLLKFIAKILARVL